MICVNCGKASDEAFCDDCFLKKNELFSIGNFSLKKCRQCGSYFSGKTKYKTIEDAILERIEEKGSIVKTEIKCVLKGVTKAAIRCCGYIKPVKKLKYEDKNIEIRAIDNKCDECSKLSGNYYEAVLQIRNKHAMNSISLPKYSIVETVDKGYNIRFMRKKDAEKLAKALRRQFTVISSCKLVGEKKGKKLYRNYYSVK